MRCGINKLSIFLEQTEIFQENKYRCWIMFKQIRKCSFYMRILKRTMIFKVVTVLLCEKSEYYEYGTFWLIDII